jgi:hypothetical protein
MRRLLLVLVSGWAATAGQSSGQKPDPGPAPKYEFEDDEYHYRPPFPGGPRSLVSSTRRLLVDEILWASQVKRWGYHWADQLEVIGLSPWEALAVGGAMTAFDRRTEPLTYHHRAGPVGAMFHELRARKGGADALAPVGVVGLGGGTVAAYTRTGQRFTFYEADPKLKALVADSDKEFTFIADARERGAKVEVKVGPVRDTLAKDEDRRYALLLVECFEVGLDPGERVTLEAIRLYRDRVTADGIVALHISNRHYRLEPVVARIARELRLAARVWADDGENYHGKTASSWAVLARDEATLGVLSETLTRQVMAFGVKNQELIRLLRKYGSNSPARVTLIREYGDSAFDPKEVGRQYGGEAATLANAASVFKAEHTLSDLTRQVIQPMFRPLELNDEVGLCRDGDKNWPAAVVFPPRKK